MTKMTMTAMLNMTDADESLTVQTNINMLEPIGKGDQIASDVLDNQCVDDDDQF